MSVSSGRPESENLVEIIDRILDKGLVIDVWARVSVVGIEILTVEARIVVASVDTFLHYAKNISALEMASQSGELEDLQNLEFGTSPLVQPAAQRPDPQIRDERRDDVEAAEAEQ